MHIMMPYGSGQIQIDVPEKHLGFYREDKQNLSNTDNLGLFKNALGNPDGPILSALVHGKSVMCLIYDASRKVPQRDFLRAVFPHLETASAISVLVATGTHDAKSPENEAICSEVKEIAEQNSLSLSHLLIHDCHNDEMVFAGQTKTQSNDIYVNKYLDNADIFLVFSDMKNHYFAGYSNAVKNFFPGVAKYDSIERNHALAMNKRSTFGYHPLHPETTRRENPLAQDMFEAYQLISRNRPVYLVATVTQGMNILWTKAGLLEKILPQGIAKVDEYLSVRVEPSDKMIVSCGGFPNDESLYMAQRALELCRGGVKSGGEVLFLAECRNEIGPKKSIINFYQPLMDPIEDILKKYETRKYIMYAHKTYKFARMINELKAIHVYSALSDDAISKIHLNPVDDVQYLIDNWISKSADVKINIFSEGSKMAVHQI